jgi:hypothetical protein
MIFKTTKSQANAIADVITKKAFVSQEKRNDSVEHNFEIVVNLAGSPYIQQKRSDMRDMNAIMWAVTHIYQGIAENPLSTGTLTTSKKLLETNDYVAAWLVRNNTIPQEFRSQILKAKSNATATMNSAPYELMGEHTRLLRTISTELKSTDVRLDNLQNKLTYLKEQKKSVKYEIKEAKRDLKVLHRKEKELELERTALDDYMNGINKSR